MNEVPMNDFIEDIQKLEINSFIKPTRVTVWIVWISNAIEIVVLTSKCVK